ncbi:BrnT family toxin [Novosphingobium resinovorum]|nr:BrnT family toxin [Novosphingobium resinovorum]
MRSLRIEYDEAKRRKILAERGIDIADAHRVFADTHIQVLDDRKDYGETRYRVFGFLHGRRVSLVWTPRDGNRRIITIRHAHHGEHQARFRTLD